MSNNSTFTITSEPFYDNLNKCYKNILMVNVIPSGPLRQFVKQIKLPKLSPFQTETPCNPIAKCGYAIHNINDCLNKCCDLMTPNEIPDLITFLTSNNYQIETQITNMVNQSEIKLSRKKICFVVTYFNDYKPNITYIR